MWTQKGCFFLSFYMRTGRQVHLRHVRGDKELPPLVDDSNYDVHYQEYRQFQRPVNVLPVSKIAFPNGFVPPVSLRYLGEWSRAAPLLRSIVPHSFFYAVLQL